MKALREALRRCFDTDSSYSLSPEEVIQGLINDEVVLFKSVARTAAATSEEQINFFQKGVIVTIVTSAIGTGEFTVKIQRFDIASGTWIDVLASAAITVNGTVSLRVYPGLTPAANLVASDVLPRRWRVVTTPANANPATFSIGAATLS